MKVGISILQPMFPIVVKKEKGEDEASLSQQPRNAKQVLKEIAQRQITAIEEARTDMGEDDPKAQRLIEKFKNGKRLTPEEMSYIRKNAPGMVDYIDRIQREREVIELGMKMAPTKTDVQMVAFRASKQIEKHHNPEEREIRAKHLADAKKEYEKTDEYKDKPNSPLDPYNKKPIRVKQKKNPKQHAQIAIQAYENTKNQKVETTTIHEC
ncbi:hypothetical protein [Lysinibacillus sp. 54212]|uniref:hypothetical protein n=1 Tax=Lysinibacillus sp. 54212 TaxID=3119829 RepID=UPI002FC6619A